MNRCENFGRHDLTMVDSQWSIDQSDSLANESKNKFNELECSLILAQYKVVTKRKIAGESFVSDSSSPFERSSDLSIGLLNEPSDGFQEMNLISSTPLVNKSGEPSKSLSLKFNSNSETDGDNLDVEKVEKKSRRELYKIDEKATDSDKN
jgi:hypothetical protein